MRDQVENRKIAVAVFFGGDSSEYGVSLESAYSVICHLDREKYDPVPVGISREGSWFLFRGDAERIREDTWQNPQDCVPALLPPGQNSRKLLLIREEGIEEIPVDVAFPVLHGRNGEDGTIQGLIGLSGIPLAGCGVLASALCMDKDRAHKLAGLSGVRVPEAFVIRRGEEAAAFEFARQIGYPLYVKPVKAGSSYGVTRAVDEGELGEAVKLAFQYDDQVIIEENIQGFEVGCAVFGRRELVVGEVDEIELAGGFFDFTEKYTLKTSAIHVPARIDEEKADEIRKTAKTIYRALGCECFARVDLFLTPEGEIVFNEVNTIPGFTAHSRYPGMMRAAGYSFERLLDTIIHQAMEREA